MNFSCKRVFTLILFLSVPLSLVSAQDLHVLKIKNVKQLHDFFKYRSGDRPIISGHRGGIVPGFPENSIAAFEHTLKQTPAFFEIDPRITKDSVIVLVHDATLDRTTTGTGKVSDYTWEQLKQLKLKDHLGHVTSYSIPTLEEAIRWSKGKTILDLDKKDVPFEMIAAIIRKNKAYSHVMLTVHSAEEARYYYNKSNKQMFAAFIRTLDEYKAYEEEGIPWSQIMAYVGPLSKPENKELYDLLHSKGVKVMISAAPSYDKLEEGERMAAYVKTIEEGADIIESDLPLDVAAALSPLYKERDSNARYFGKKNLSTR
ncbi:MAG TPA: glycerophosphodiester phosphodiesterase family protein [Cyclobacteriaceae bacterium]|nr:glycerophosphodiester phosphodiesterase family protein [Cyclobacteriaceae bacterium]